MTRILRIDCSITDSQSISRRLSSYFVQKWMEVHPGSQVETRDLVASPLPHFNFDNLMGMMLAPETRTGSVRAAAALSEELINQLERAELLLLGSPMYNFTICSQLKAWLDHVTLAGRTFRYVAPNVSEGLLKDRMVYVIAARGGDYSAQPYTAWDFQEPLLRHWFSFLGLTSVHFIKAEGLKVDPERTLHIVEAAERRIDHLIGSSSGIGES